MNWFRRTLRVLGDQGIRIWRLSRRSGDQEIRIRESGNSDIREKPQYPNPLIPKPRYPNTRISQSKSPNPPISESQSPSPLIPQSRYPNIPIPSGVSFNRFFFRAARICAVALLAVSVSLWLAWAVQSTFTQSNWSSGIPATSGACTTAGGTWSGTECLATSPSYTGYSTKDTGIVAGTDIKLQPTDDTATHTSDYGTLADGSNTGSGDICTSTSCNIGGGFNAGTKRINDAYLRT